MRDQNVLALKLWRPHDNAIRDKASVDLAMPFVDWNPPPLDGGLGVWRGVEVSQFAAASAAVTVRYPQVATRLSSAARTPSMLSGPASHAGSSHGDKAVHCDTSITVQLYNSGAEAVAGRLGVSVHWANGSTHLPLNFSVPFHLPAAGEAQAVTVNSSHASVLDVRDCEALLWWPWQMGQSGPGDAPGLLPGYKPPLHRLVVQVSVISGTELVVTDGIERAFGLREVTKTNMPVGGGFAPGDNMTTSALFKINGRRLLVRGGGYTSEIFWRQNRSTFLRDVFYVGIASRRRPAARNVCAGAVAVEALGELESR